MFLGVRIDASTWLVDLLMLHVEQRAVNNEGENVIKSLHHSVLFVRHSVFSSHPTDKLIAYRHEP